MNTFTANYGKSLPTITVTQNGDILRSMANPSSDEKRKELKAYFDSLNPEEKRKIFGYVEPPKAKSRLRRLFDNIVAGPKLGGANKWFSINASTSDEEPTEIEIYDKIGIDWCSGEGVEAAEFAKALKAIPKTKKILVRVNSPGGSVNDGLLIYNLLNERRSNVTVRVDGMAASIASVIILAGSKIEMPRNAKIMVHNPSTVVEGDSRDMRKTAEKLDLYRDSMAGIYSARTGLTEEQIIKMMDEETWMTGDMAKEHGFCHVVTDEEIDFQACASFDFSNFKRTPEQLKNKQENKGENMNREQLIARLKELGIEYADSASDAVLQALITQAEKVKSKAKSNPDPVKKPAPKAADVEDLDSEEEAEAEDEEEAEPAPRNRIKAVAKKDNRLARVEGELKKMEARYAEERKQSITAAVRKCVDENRIPEPQAEEWIESIIEAGDAGGKILARLEAMEPKRPGRGEPITAAITSENPLDVQAGILAMREPLKSFLRGNDVSCEDIAINAKRIGATIAKHREKLNTILATNTVHTDLKRNVILSDQMRAFKRRLLMLNAFTTRFNNIPLEGTTKVIIPFYDLDTGASKNFSYSTGYEFDLDTSVGKREVTVDKRKYQPMDFTSEDFRRQPYFSPSTSLMLKAEKLALDVWTDILSSITGGNFPTAIHDGEPNNFDIDDIIQIQKACEDRDWPEVGAALVLGTAHKAAILSDESMKHFMNSGSTDPLRLGATGRLLNFEMIYSPRIPSNSQDLVGFACLPQALLVATSPIAPAPGVRQNLLSYDVIVDSDTGIAFEYRFWGSAQADKDRQVIECNYGHNVGYEGALLRITGGAVSNSSSSSLSSANSSSSSSSSSN